MSETVYRVPRCECKACGCTSLRVTADKPVCRNCRMGYHSPAPYIREVFTGAVNETRKWHEHVENDR